MGLEAGFLPPSGKRPSPVPCLPAVLLLEAASAASWKGQKWLS